MVRTVGSLDSLWWIRQISVVVSPHAPRNRSTNFLMLTGSGPEAATARMMYSRSVTVEIRFGHLTHFDRPMPRSQSSKSRRSAAIILALVCLAGALNSVVRADEPADLEFFEKKVRPLLVEHCYECHSADSRKIGGGLRLDSRAGWQTGGDTGPAVAPGEPEDSLLLTAIRYADDSVKMPPKGKLPNEAIAVFEDWIRRGAPDPRTGTAPARSASNWDQILRERSDWWSLKPVQPPEVPSPRHADWSDRPIDRFVLARLEQHDLFPARDADSRTLARRLSLVLTGLPPTVEELNAFLADVDRESNASGSLRVPPAAVRRYLDRLLESPHFGERWARHWMDVVRFTETHGNEWNYEVHHAWRYRDYLIRAFNHDLPYDQMVREHIAGDLLPEPRWSVAGQFNESPIGTAFFRFGEANHDDCIALRQIGYDLADNQIDTLTKAFLGTTVACARCHDHKLDPVSMKDYYALLGVLRSSRFVSHSLTSLQINAQAIERLQQLKGQLKAELGRAWREDATTLSRYITAAWARRAKHSDADEQSQGLDPARLAAWEAALPAEPLPLENPLEPLRLLADDKNHELQAFAEAWGALAGRFAQEDQSRQEFNTTGFATLADFRTRPGAVWQRDGQGLQGGISASGDLHIAPEGDRVASAILPAGLYTHGVSERLQGALRSPVLSSDHKRISLRVLGQRSSAVRLVSSHCQLNYRNYRALTNDQPHWVTFEIPADAASLRTYAELMTMFHNPKFPDQLSALGGDPANYKLPWEQAAANPRSFFGITHVVVHDGAEAPRGELGHLRSIFAGPAPGGMGEVADRYAQRSAAAIESWCRNEASDDDALWLDALVRRGLLRNSLEATPALRELVTEYRQLEESLELPVVAPGVGDSGEGYDQAVFVRGESHRPGEVVPRRFLEMLDRECRPYEGAGSGRLELARQLASAQNPLTARVMVNRVWHHLFGTGLVKTVDDFGHVGEFPSHPDLLDYLSDRFAAEGWSLKRLIRQIVESRTFQLAHDPAPHARELDPQNRWLQHYPARRLEAEGIRDSILAVSGRLDRALYGPSIQPFRATENADRRLFPGPLDGNGRRSVYIKNNLMEAPQFLEAFNFPGGKVTQGRRDVTNVPGQALTLLNDPFVIQQAEVWGQSLVQRQDASVRQRLEAMFVRALCRPPSDEELSRFETAATQFAELNGVPSEEILASATVWKDLAHALFNLQEFVYVP